MIDAVLLAASTALSIGGAWAYMRDTIAGTTKPNRVSWSLWAANPLIGTGAALASGADVWATLRIFLAGFLPLIVLVASWRNPNSYWQTSSFDRVCGLLALLALAAWLGVESPRAAILLAAVADGFASIPTIIKAWRHPETETGMAYLTGLLSVALVVPTIPVWNIENSAFQIYLIIVNIVLITAVYRKRIPGLAPRT